MVASLFLAAAAYAGGLLAMAYTQGFFVRTLDLRFVLILSEAALALPAVIVALLLAGSVPEVHRFRPVSAKALLLTVALGLAFWTLSLGVFEAQYVWVKPPLAYLQQFQGLHESLKPASLFGWVFSICAIAVAPAICEEILFRGLLTPVLRKAAGSVFAIVVSAALFGAIHVDALADGTSVYYRVPFAFVLGLLLAGLRIETGSLWPPVIAHATLNATTFCVVVLVAEEPTNALPDPRPLMALGMLVLGSVAARALMRQIRPVAPGA
jgi:membrane protease YdiL (CAAX protease family)